MQPDHNVTGHNATGLTGIFMVSAMLVWGVGCDRNKSPSQSPSAESTEAESTEAESTPSEERESWRQVSEEELDEPARQKLQRARQAQKDLGSTLKRELLGAIKGR